MNYKEYLKLIGQKTVKPLCIMTGEEEYVKGSVLKKLKEAFLEESMADFDYCQLNDDNASFEAVATAVSTPALSSPRKMVQVNVKPTHTLLREERFLSLCQSLTDQELLILKVSGSLDGRNSQIKKLEALGDVVYFEKIEKTDIVKWTVARCKTYGKVISIPDAEYLIFLAGEDVCTLGNEIAKIVDYSDETQITRQAIDKLVTHTPEHGVFQLVDAVAAKDGAKALRQCELLFSDGVEELQMLALIVRQMQLILRYLSFTKQGMQQKMIMEQMKLKPFVFNKVKQQAGAFTLEGCKEAMTQCLDLDYRIKSGAIGGRTGMELLLTELCKKA